jgi:hypothetical protein
MSSSILEIIFGAFVVSGDSMCRSMLLEFLRFAVYTYTSISIMLISAFRNIHNDSIYNEVIYNLSVSHYEIEPHLNEYPDLYVVLGWLIIINGIMRLIAYVHSSLKK